MVCKNTPNLISLIMTVFLMKIHTHYYEKKTAKKISVWTNRHAENKKQTKKATVFEIIFYTYTWYVIKSSSLRYKLVVPITTSLLPNQPVLLKS